MALTVVYISIRLISEIEIIITAMAGAEDRMGAYTAKNSDV